MSPRSTVYMWRRSGEDVWYTTSGARSQMNEVPFTDNFEYYFGLACLKTFARDLLEIENEKNIKYSKKMIFNKEHKLYHEANNTCYICINKVRDHCHQTGKYIGPAYKNVI